MGIRTMATHDASTSPRLEPHIEGAADGPMLFFVQGWPDDLTLWDEFVSVLRDRYRCVRVNLPNYPGAEYRRWGYDHDAMVEGLAHCIREVSPGRPLTLIAHDWGAVWGYRLHHRHPELISRFVALDIGPVVRPSPGEAAFIVAYQFWLATAFMVGGGIGDWMTRRMARRARSPRQGEAITSAVNYPYLYTWKELLSGRAPNLSQYAPQVPVFFAFGRRKPSRFHTQRWIDFVQSRPGNEVLELARATHWVTLDASLKDRVKAFLDRTNGSRDIGAE
jgi:cis-3-alkyl-4-acyloxetan-2-one decarboxylase